MTPRRLLSATLALGLIAGACTTPPSVTPVPTATSAATKAVLTATPASIATEPIPASGVLISEILAGVQGNNVYEFIELYNPTDQPVDLRNWTLWYRLATSTEDLPVYRWRQRALIPPHGHYLLGQAGQDLGVLADAEFDQGLNTTGGGLLLRLPEGSNADIIGWGKAPAEFVEGTPAPPLENGVSLERAPGGEGGNAADTDDNAVDFSLNKAPTPQNTGSPITPTVEHNNKT